MKKSDTCFSSKNQSSFAPHSTLNVYTTYPINQITTITTKIFDKYLKILIKYLYYPITREGFSLNPSPFFTFFYYFFSL